MIAPQVATHFNRPTQQLTARSLETVSKRFAGCQFTFRSGMAPGSPYDSAGTRRRRAMIGRGARRPVSRVLSAASRRGGRTRDGHSSGTRIAARLARPTRAAGRECPRGPGPSPCRRPPLFGLAPGGVCPAAPVARGAVRSCRTVSPLPVGDARSWRRARAVCFLWHCPWGRPRRPLTGTVFPWSPDFPPPQVVRQRPSSRLARGFCEVARPRSRAGRSLARKARALPWTRQEEPSWTGFIQGKAVQGTFPRRSLRQSLNLASRSLQRAGTSKGRHFKGPVRSSAGPRPQAHRDSGGPAPLPRRLAAW